MLLKDKTAIIYGAGAVGSAVAEVFVQEGATIFLAGHTFSKLESAAKKLASSEGKVQIAQLDALDLEAVENHAAKVWQETGRIDISFNLIGLGNGQGKPVIEINPESFTSIIQNAMRSQFITATTAARYMAKRKAGIILALTAQAAKKPYSNVGGFGVAGAAIEALCRQLALELGSDGIRVVCLRSSGSPDTPGVEEAWRSHAENEGITYENWRNKMIDKTLLKRLPLLKDVAKTAALMASDYASTVTGAITNVTCGELVD